MSDPNAFDRVSPGGDSDWKAAWDTEDNFWFENFTSRPYALGPDFYERFRPAYRYGFESARHHVGRQWEDAEPDLREGWDRYEHRGDNSSTWDDIKAAVRDAWDRVVGTSQSSTEGRTPNTRE
ncbi:MAG TPA: hypothetical protein VKA25_07975 [Gemmatimonadales bacterium]|nr:hypothetical protein [Gemmatimonadales bacterium]